MKLERVEQDDYDGDDEEPLAVRVEKWRSGEAIHDATGFFTATVDWIGFI